MDSEEYKRKIDKDTQQARFIKSLQERDKPFSYRGMAVRMPLGCYGLTIGLLALLAYAIVKWLKL